MPNSAVAVANSVRAIKPDDGSRIPIGELMERIIAAGDLSRLEPGDRAHYLVRVAESAGLNPLSQPFDLIPGQGGKLVLYANKRATDQLRKLYGLTSRIVEKVETEGVYVVEVEVSDGRRTETNIGAVPIAGLKGETLANALMKTFTKAKRRATLDYCGLGVLDESEIEGLREAMTERPQSRAETVPAVVSPSRSQDALAVLQDGIPEAELVDRATGELLTVESVKRDVRALAREHEWSNDDLKSVADRLGLPAWVKLTLEEAATLRDEVGRLVEMDIAGWDASRDADAIDADSQVSA